MRQKHIVFNPIPHVVIWFYKRNQKIYSQLFREGSVNEFIEEQPQNISHLKNILVRYPKQSKKILILDDLMESVGGMVSELFTNFSHHYNTSVIYITQNLFYQKNEFRTISLNCHYVICMRNLRDQSQIYKLAQQLRPAGSKCIVKMFKEATKKPHSYLLIDVHPSQIKTFQFRTNIFPTLKDPMVLYVPEDELF